MTSKNLKTAEFLQAESELLLHEARKQKAEKYKTVGDPIELSGVPIDVKVRGRYAWLAENTTTVRKLDLESRKTVQIYKGHTGPVTCLAFCDSTPGSGDSKILISGSWDKTIRLWNTDIKTAISTTTAHTDFVKTLLVIPSLNLLVSGSSDKSVRFWDLSSPLSPNPLESVGSISSHTRPVQCLDAYVTPSGSDDAPEVTLFTADTMGVIKVWSLKKEGEGGRYRWKHTQKDEFTYHRTGVNEMVYGNGLLWTASTDESIRMHPYPPTPGVKPYPPLTYTKAFKTLLSLPIQPQLDADAFPYVLGGSGDTIRICDVSSPEEPEFVKEVEGHWHDVTHLRLWLRDSDDKRRKEVWVISASLDTTLRRWKLAELLSPPAPQAEEKAIPIAKPQAAPSGLTEEEERELAELMHMDDE
ncbi:hypothetical protein EVG20_g3634 [Dentipellis fragilis]|uniref:Uncharacterized protein n=1 Tax=Dentipellis fragilis TaxID=205917 RepID=A0A4Y9Z137_9AGAM|nr:hypothetical protein EVG20_g3634 [Dentipellis fragilis]